MMRILERWLSVLRTLILWSLVFVLCILSIIALVLVASIRLMMVAIVSLILKYKWTKNNFTRSIAITVALSWRIIFSIIWVSHSYIIHIRKSKNSLIPLFEFENLYPIAIFIACLPYSSVWKSTNAIFYLKNFMYNILLILVSSNPDFNKAIKTWKNTF